MGIKKLPSGNWRVRVQPNGRNGKVYQATRNTKAEAQQTEKELIQKYTGASETRQTNQRLRLKDMAQLWYDLYGQTLKDGKARKMKLDNACDGLGNPLAPKFSAAMYVNYRKERLDGGAKPATVNRELSYLRAMFNFLSSSGNWHSDNPLDNIKALRTEQPELTYLDKPQRKRLIDACSNSRNRHLLPIVLTILSTGARWGEVESLKPSQVKDHRIQFFATKSGKRRIIPIPAPIYTMLKEHVKHSRDKLFGGSIEAFENALDNASIKLPDGQLTHVLRHTYAVEFMEGGGNIVHLQKILGHSHIVTTSIYLAFAPDNLESSLTLNPVAKDEMNIAELLRCRDIVMT